MISLQQNAWFAAQVVPKSEKRVAEILEYKGYQHYVPTYEVKKKWSDRTKTLEEPLFPGYVFVRMSGIAFGPVVTTPGLIRILSRAGHPVPLSDTEIDSVRTLTRFAKPQPLPHVEMGQKVRVMSGVFAGVVGTVRQISNRSCLVVSVQLTSTSICVGLEDLEALQLQVQ